MLENSNRQLVDEYQVWFNTTGTEVNFVSGTQAEYDDDDDVTGYYEAEDYPTCSCSFTSIKCSAFALFLEGLCLGNLLGLAAILVGSVLLLFSCAAVFRVLGPERRCVAT